MIPSRNPADRSLFGIAEFSITYRFAGVHQPGVAVPRPLTEPNPQTAVEMQQLTDRINQLTTLLSNVGISV
jgi:hypothetical protein